MKVRGCGAPTAFGAEIRDVAKCGTKPRGVGLVLCDTCHAKAHPPKPAATPAPTATEGRWACLNSGGDSFVNILGTWSPIGTWHDAAALRYPDRKIVRLMAEGEHEAAVETARAEGARIVVAHVLPSVTTHALAHLPRAAAEELLSALRTSLGEAMDHAAKGRSQ